MNYAGKFDATFASEGSGAHHHAYVHVDSSQTHAPADAIVVPDAQLLFHADYSRSGTDLILSRDHHEYVLHDYFRGEKRASLASPDGAHLTADIVKALVGEVEVSQAGTAPAASQVIGHVTKLQGSATVIRNGVSIILNMGENVEKGDVVESGANSTIGITFIDGTVFGLSSNARMVLNEMVYDPNGSSNSSLLSLVAGTITFVAGETAKHGDMKIDTPVATMGIRGTAVLVEIDFSVPGQNSQPNASFQVLVEPDGTTGSYILFDKTTLQPIAIVNQAGQQVNINNGIINITTNPLSPDLQKLITDVFQQKFTDNTNTKSTSPSTDSIIPTSNPLVIKTAEAIITTQTVNVLGSSTPPPSTLQSESTHHIAGPPTVHIGNLLGAETSSFLASGELVGQTGSPLPDGAAGIINFNDINVGDQPSVTAAFSSFTYTNAHGQNVTAGLSALQLAKVVATEVDLTIIPGANNTNTGSALFTYSIADHAFDFLAAGEQITLTYTITVNDNFAPAPDKINLPITITITGTNDVPVITTAAQSIAFTPSGTKTIGGALQTQNPTSGTFTFTDVDLTDTHTVATKLTGVVMSNGGTLPPLPESVFETALTASILPGNDSTGTGTGTINWQLVPLQTYLADFIPPGQTVTLTYTVTVTDSQGATATQTITVVISGDASPAVVWIHTTTDGQDNLWSDKLDWGTGTVPTATDDVIISTDQLHPHTPSYPAMVDGTTAAVANSVTMNDFVGLPPELDVAQGGSLTIGGALSMSADSKVDNAGTITVGGKAELLDSFDDNGKFLALNQSVIVNSGTLNLGQGGDFQGLASITNTGTIDLKGGVLNVLVDIANSGTNADGKIVGGQITVETGASLVLGTDTNTEGGSGGITGGVLTIVGELDLQGLNFLDGGTLSNSGNVYVSGLGNSFDDERVTNSNAIEARSGAALTIDQGSSVANTGTLTVDDTATLTLNDATITGGTINDYSSTVGGIIHVTGASKINGGATLNNGTVNVDAKLTLDTMTVSGTTIRDNSGGIELDNTVKLTGGATIQGSSSTTLGAITNLGTLEVLAAAAATLTDIALTNSTSTDAVQVDVGSTLTLNASTISGGQLNNSGLVEIEAAGTTSTFNGVDITNNGVDAQIRVDTGLQQPITLKLDGGTSINQGKVTVGPSGILEISGAQAVTLDNVAVSDGNSILVDVGSLLLLDGTSITGTGAVTVSGELDNGSGSNTIDGAVTNTGTIDVKAGTTLDLAGGLSGVGTVKIDAGATLKLGGASAETFTFTGGSGTSTLELDSTAVPFNGTITVNATTGGTLVVTGQGSITTTSGDGLDFNASGGTSNVPANVTLTLGGAIKGAVNGIVVTQNGYGSLTVDTTGAVTGHGAGGTGLLVQNLNAGNDAAISVSATGGASGDVYGINVVNAGNGHLTLEAGGTITTGSNPDSRYGIRVYSEGTGSEAVTTDPGTNITSASTGINAVNVDTSIASNAESSITVTSSGTIHSESTPNNDGSVAGGIYAGYRGGTVQNVPNPVPDTQVNGTVTVNNNANITADAGYGINAFNWGVGNVTVNEGAGTTISAAQTGIGAYSFGGEAGDVTVNIGTDATITGSSKDGIEAYTTGSGQIAVTTAATDTITGGTSGIAAVNAATSLDADSNSTVTVNAYGTINSGASPDGLQTSAGILAGYAGNGANGPSPTPNPDVHGAVTVNNHADVTASAGYGIDAFNWGQGNVTVNDEDGTTVSGITAGIGAFSHGGGIGDVTVHLFGDAQVSSASGFGVTAVVDGSGAVTITTEQDTSITAGATGINISAVSGEVSVVNAGSITGSTGVGAIVYGAGNVFVTNNGGEITGTAGSGIDIGQSTDAATGSTTVTNSGTITGGAVTSDGVTTQYAAIALYENATGKAEIDNSGTIGSSAQSNAIYEHGGDITINNTGQGVIDGSITAANATFNNELGATWNAGGASDFGVGAYTGAEASAIDNAGTINLSDNASISDAHGLIITDSGTIDNQSGSGAIDDAAITVTSSGTLESTGGTLTIDALSSITVAAGGTLEANGGNLVINGTLSGNAVIAGSSMIEFGDSTAGAYSSAILTFGSDSTGTLKIDGGVNFSGAVSGFGQGMTIDLAGVAQSASEYDVWSNGTLSIYSGTALEAQLKFLGSYNQNDFALARDSNGGTEIVWSKAQAATVSGLDSAGNPVDGYAATAHLNDSNATGVTYTWLENGAVVATGPSNSYTPASSLEVGKALDVVIGFTDNGVSEQITELAGTVAAAPSVNLPAGPVTTIEDTALALGALSATFADAGSDMITATIIVGHGKLTIANEGEIGSANDAASIILTGTLAQIDQALASGVSYAPGAAFAGSDSLSFSISDAASGTTFSASGTLDITVNPAAPALTVSSNALNVAESHSIALNISETPFDPADTVSIKISGVPADASLSAGTNDGGGVWTLTPAELAGLTFNANDTSANLLVTATNTKGATASATQTIDITVVPPPVLSGPMANAVSDTLQGASLNSALWTAVLPPMSAENPYDAAVTPTVGVGLELANRGTLETVAGFTPTSATPLKISFSFTLGDSGDTLFITEQTSGATDPTYGAASDGISYQINWFPSGDIRIINAATNQGGTAVSDSGLVAGKIYDAVITDDGSHQTFSITDTSDNVLATATSHIALGIPPGDLITFANRENNDGGGGAASHTTTISDVSISSAYESKEHATVQLGITDSDTTSGTVSITGLPQGLDPASFNGGTYTATTGTWTGTATEFNNLSFTSGTAGTFDLTVTATNSVGETATHSYVLNVNADHWNSASAEWSTGADWSYGSAPVSNIDAVVDANGTHIVTILDGDWAVAHSLTVTSSGADIHDEGSLTLTGALTIDAGSFSLIDGSLSAASIDVESAGHFIAEGSVSAPITNNGGVVEAYGHLSLSGTVTGNGTFDVNGHTLTFDSSVAGGTVDFGADNNGGTVEVAEASNFHAAISNFGSGDTIELTGLDYAAGEHARWAQGSGGSGTLTIYNNANVELASFQLNGTYTSNEFAVTKDHDSDVDITFTTSSDRHGGVDVALDPVSIDTQHFTLAHNADGTTTINDLSINDTDQAHSLTLSATTEASGSSITPPLETGSLEQVDFALSRGITYNPGSPAPAQDQVTLTVTDQAGNSAVEHFIFNQGGSGPGIDLQGTSGNDVIFATGNADTMTGGGGMDQFVFKPSSANDSGSVQHVITDFDVHLDTIDLRQLSNVGSAAQVLAAATQQTVGQETDTLLTLDTHQTLLLKNVTLSSLHASDFIVTAH